jgi:hypothetical protein
VLGAVDEGTVVDELGTGPAVEVVDSSVVEVAGVVVIGSPPPPVQAAAEVTSTTRASLRMVDLAVQGTLRG